MTATGALAWVLCTFAAVGFLVARRRTPLGRPAPRRARGLGAAFAVTVGGALTTVWVTAVAGVVARHVFAPPDRSGYEWFVEQFDATSTWTEANRAITVFGDPPRVELAALAVAVVGAALAVWRRRMPWWLPAVGAATALVLQRSGQRLVIEMVGSDPARPPDLGTYPSGGVSRLLAVWSVGLVIVWLASDLRPSVARAGIALLGVAGLIEGATRLVLLKHYPTDTIGGLLLGGGIGATVGAATNRWAAARGGGLGRRPPGHEAQDRAPVPPLRPIGGQNS